MKLTHVLSGTVRLIFSVAIIGLFVTVSFAESSKSKMAAGEILRMVLQKSPAGTSSEESTGKKTVAVPKAADDLYVVGIISGSSVSSKGLVVIKNEKTKKTFNLRVGDQVPGLDAGWAISKIERRSVLMEFAGEIAEIAYGRSNMKNFVATEDDSYEEGLGLSDVRETEYVTDVYRDWMEKNRKAIDDYRKNLITDRENVRIKRIIKDDTGEFEAFQQDEVVGPSEWTENYWPDEDGIMAKKVRAEYPNNERSFDEEQNSDSFENVGNYRSGRYEDENFE